MKPNELAAIIFGVLGFLFSCVALFKSMKDGRQARYRELAQKRNDVLGTVLTAGAKTREQRRKYWEFREECRSEGDLEYANMAQETMDALDKKLDAIEAARLEVMKDLPVEQYDQIYASLDRVATEMGPIAEGSDWAERDREFFDLARNNLRLKRELKQAEGMQPD